MLKKRLFTIILLLLVGALVVSCQQDTAALDAAKEAAAQAEAKLAAAEKAATEAEAAAEAAMKEAEAAQTGNAEELAAAEKAAAESAAAAEAAMKEAEAAQAEVETAKAETEAAMAEAAAAAAAAEAEAEAVVEGPLEADGLTACNPIPEIASASYPGYRTTGVASPIINPQTEATVPQVIHNPEATQTEADLARPPQQGGGTYRVGVFEDVTTLNFWAANGPDNTVWNSYMLPQVSTLYTLSDQRFDVVPKLALEMPAPLNEEGDVWVSEIPIRDDVTWNDGTPFTAEDVAFTANTVVRLGLLSGNWATWYDKNFIDHVEAADDYTVKFYFHTKPGLARYEWGILQAPILAAHYWAPHVDEAAASIEALGENPSEEDLIAAQAEAQDILFAVDASDEPHAGAFLYGKWEAGAFIENPANPNYFDMGTSVTQYANGAYEDSNGTVLYGEPTGDVILEYDIGPFVDATVYSVYGSQDAAILAVQAGEIDVMINPLGLQRGLMDRVEGDENLTVVQNPVNGFRYMSFNNRRRPMNDCAFRQAVAVLIDKEFVTDTILQGVAFPQYTFVPESNGAWYYDEVPKLGQGLSREDRINLAVTILEEAGYSWEGDVKPAWNNDGGHVDAGGALIMPDGTPVPELELWGPSAGYDPLRSTFAVWIESWMNEAGIPVRANLAGFNVLIPRIFTEHDFDMYILGWSLSLFPDYLRDFFSSEQAIPDGNNAGGYTSTEFDELADQILACEEFDVCRELANQIQIKLSTEVPYVLLFDTGIIEPYRNASVELPYTDHLSGLQYAHQTGGPIQSEVNMK